MTTIENKCLILLGAGASVEANLPKASELFDNICSKIQKTTWKELLIKLKDISQNNFEDSISALEFLSTQNFSNLELILLNTLSENKYLFSKDFLVDIYELVDFIKRKWINDEFIIKDSTKVKYLFPLINFCKQNNSNIFTLNYDDTVEKAACALNIKYSIGFGDSNELKTEFFSMKNFEPINQDFNLYKLHGSIGWFISKISSDKLYNNVYKPIEYNKNDFEDRISKPAIILGSKNKLTAEGMYLDLLMTFRKQLNEANYIFIIGYSFSDNHINKYIQEAWMDSPNKIFFIVDPTLPDPNILPAPSFLGGAYETKGGYDFRNLFCAVGNPNNNKLYIINKTTSEFCLQLKNNNNIEVQDWCGLFANK